MFGIPPISDPTSGTRAAMPESSAALIDNNTINKDEPAGNKGICFATRADASFGHQF